MSRKRLATNEMLHLSGEWLNPESPAYQAIMASSDLSPSLARIESAHHDLAHAAQPTALKPRLFEIIKEQADVDDRHDDLVRGVHGLLTATAALLDDEEGAHFLALRDQLIPDGLATVQKSYAAESGAAAQLAHRITPEIRAELEKLYVGPHKTQQHRLSVYVDELIQLGAKLGALETEKARLNPEASASSSANLITARNKWIRIVNLFLAIAEAAEISEEMDRVVFGPLRVAEAKADRRARAVTPPNENQTESPTAEG